MTDPSPILDDVASRPSANLAPPEGAEDQIVEASDGYRLAVRRWPVPEGQTTRGRILLIHGIQSHAGWYDGLGQRLAMSGFEAVFPDRRGSGRNTVARGDTTGTTRLVRDLRQVLASTHDDRADQRVPLAVVGISWGGKLAVLLAADSRRPVSALALITPGLFAQISPPLGTRLRIGLARMVRPRKRFPIPLNDPELFTEVLERRRFIAEDQLALREATARLLSTSVRLDVRVRLAAPSIRCPSLLQLAGRDRIIANDKTRAFFKAFPATDKTVLEYPEAQHTLEFEPDPTRYAQDLIAWLIPRLQGGDPAVDGHVSESNHTSL